MLKIYNKTALTRNQRFINALIYSIPTAIGLALAYGLVVNIIHIEFSIFFVGIGYLIGLVIQNMGRGVQLKFSILGAVLALCSFLLGDMIAMYGFSIFLYPSYIPIILGNILISWVSVSSINGLIGTAFRVAGIYFAYVNSRMV